MESIIRFDKPIAFNMDSFIQDMDVIINSTSDINITNIEHSVYKPPPKILPNSFDSIIHSSSEVSEVSETNIEQQYKNLYELTLPENNIKIIFNFDTDTDTNSVSKKHKLLFESDIFKFKIYQTNLCEEISQKKLLSFIDKLYNLSYDDFLNESNSIKEISEQQVFPFPIPEIPVLSYAIDKKSSYDVNSIVSDTDSGKIIGVIVLKSSFDECMIIPMRFLCKMIKSLIINNKFYIFPYEEEIYEVQNLEQPYNNIFCVSIASTTKIEQHMLKNNSLIIKINDKIVDENGRVCDGSINIPLSIKSYLLTITEPSITILYYPNSKTQINNVKYLSYEYSIDIYNSDFAMIPLLLTETKSYSYKDYNFKILDALTIMNLNMDLDIDILNKISKLDSYKDNYVYTYNKLTNHIMILTRIRLKKITSFDMMKEYLSKISANDKLTFNFVNLNMESIKIKL
jgi:hypothetical protein